MQLLNPAGERTNEKGIVKFPGGVGGVLIRELRLASAEEVFAQRTAQALHHAHLRIYASSDVIGVEVGGAVKNVMAIAAGICDGL